MTYRQTLMNTLCYLRLVIGRVVSAVNNDSYGWSAQYEQGLFGLHLSTPFKMF